MKRMSLPAAALFGLVSAVLLVPQAAAQAETWGFVTSIIGPNVVLDDGTLVRIGGGTRIVRADGSAGRREDVNRRSRVIVRYAADGSVSELRVFAPRTVQSVYLSNLPPIRGAAYVTTATVGAEARSRSLALARVTYTRPPNWTQFRAEVRYNPGGAGGAPAAARFMLKDSFGDLIVDRVVSAGQTAPLSAGLDANATDRLTLEVAPAGEGQVEQDWCLWLDPRLIIALPTPSAAPLSNDVPERLVKALTETLGETKIDGLAIAQFTAVRSARDQSFLRDLNEDLLVLLGRKCRAVGVYRKTLDVGAPLPDANRKELQKLGAAYVLTGSVNWRTEGTVINALIVQVDNGALIAAVSIRG